MGRLDFIGPFLVVTMIRNWNFWPFVSKGSNTKYPSMCRAFPHHTTCLFQMSVVSWLRNIEWWGEREWFLYPIYAIGWGKRFCFELVAFLKRKAVRKWEQSFSVYCFYQNTLNWFYNPLIFPKPNVGLNMPPRESRASQAPGEWVHPDHYCNDENPRKEHFQFFFFFPTDCQVKKGPTIKQ